VGGFLASIRGYAVPRFVRDDYLASYEGDRLTRSAALVRAYPKDLAALAPRLASINIPVAIVVGRNDPYGLVRDAELLRQQLPHARLERRSRRNHSDVDRFREGIDRRWAP